MKARHLVLIALVVVLPAGLRAQSSSRPELASLLVSGNATDGGHHHDGRRTRGAQEPPAESRRGRSDAVEEAAP